MSIDETPTTADIGRDGARAEPSAATGASAEPSAAADNGDGGARHTDAATTPSTGPASTRAALRALLLRLHFYAGIFVAPFLLIAATTGLLYIWTPQLERVVYSDALTVPAGEERLSLEEQVAAATAAQPDLELHAVRPATEPEDTTRVLFESPDVPEFHRMAVFVDPYTGEVRGELSSYGHSGALPIRSWLSELHRHLHLGEAGRLYSELAASWLWVVAGVGLLLWVGRRRRRRARGLFAPDLAASGRRRTLSWHGAVGVWAVVGLVALSATGLTWSAYAGGNVTAMREAFGWQTPTLTTTAPSAEHAEHGADDDAGHEEHADHTDHGEHADHASHDVDIDGVLAAAHGASVDGAVEIVVPSADQGVYTVSQLRSQWPTQRDAVAVDPGSGEVVEELRFADYSTAAKLTRWGIDAHMGVLFGVANQVVLTVLVVAGMTLAVLGYRMWWQRRPVRDSAFAMGRPLPRGAWRALPGRYRILVVAVAVAVGWFLPVLGVSLLLFLACDVVLAWWASRRGGGTGQPAPTDAETPAASAGRG